jgi:hypothetical protein
MFVMMMMIGLRLKFSGLYVLLIFILKQKVIRSDGDFGEISGSHGSEFEHDGFLGCCAV